MIHKTTEDILETIIDTTLALNNVAYKANGLLIDLPLNGTGVSKQPENGEEGQSPEVKNYPCDRHDNEEHCPSIQRFGSANIVNKTQEIEAYQQD